jgi:hypothetical protein
MISRAVTAIGFALLCAPTFAAADDISTPVPSGAKGASLWTPQDGDTIRFDVLRKGKPFGTHSVTFDVSADGTMKATTDVRLRAGLGPLTVFHYELDSTETWQDGQLVGLKGAVDDNGKEGSVSAARDGQSINVNGTEFAGEVPLGILPASHWNFAQMTASQLLSTEDGELIKVTIVDKGNDTVTVAGKPIQAHHYLMDSKIDVDLWYDAEGRWVKLSFEARGQQIEYVLSSLF